MKSFIGHVGRDIAIDIHVGKTSGTYNTSSDSCKLFWVLDNKYVGQGCMLVLAYTYLSDSRLGRSKTGLCICKVAIQVSLVVDHGVASSSSSLPEQRAWQPVEQNVLLQVRSETTFWNRVGSICIMWPWSKNNQSTAGLSWQGRSLAGLGWLVFWLTTSIRVTWTWPLVKFHTFRNILFITHTWYQMTLYWINYMFKEEGGELYIFLLLVLLLCTIFTGSHIFRRSTCFDIGKLHWTTRSNTERWRCRLTTNTRITCMTRRWNGWAVRRGWIQ